jgi:hypothetical protein
MIILRQDDVKKFVSVARGRNFGGRPMLDGGDTASVFVGEHAWDTGVVGGSGHIDLPQEFYGVPYCVPSVRLSPKRGEYDFSSTTDKSIRAPNNDLIAAMRLQVEGPMSYAFLGTDGRVAFIDVAATRSEADMAVVRAAGLEEVLDAQKLCPIWIFWSEKDGGLGAGPHFASRQFSRTVFGGCYWRESGSWKASGEWRVTDDR